MTLIHVVPGLPPLVCGTGEYALTLARCLRSGESWDNRFVVLNGRWHGAQDVDGFPAEPARLSTSSLVPLLQPAAAPDATVLLHYENYSYGTRGLPFWLIRALRAWRKAGHNRRLVTVFHALFASDAPWRSSFWLSPLQKSLSAQLRRLSDAAVALGQEDAARLASWCPEGRRHVVALSVTSAVGELESAAALASREPRLVVFGREATRTRAYRAQRRQLEYACHSLGLKEILDVGPAIRLPAFDGLRLRSLGTRSAAEVSAILASSLAGFFSYPSEDLVKSSVLASYLAHGMLAITGARYRPCQDGPLAGVHYWRARPGAEPPSPAERQLIAHSGARWYSSHGHSRVAAPAYARLLREACA